jgi:RNA polymerase sigma-70 factor (ECF subfamily)
MAAVADAETLFAHYHDRLLRYLSRASGERETARDLTQEVFLRVSRTAIPTASEGQLAGWLFRIARNVALDHHRRRQRHPEAGAPTFERAHDATQELGAALAQALAALSDLDRDVFLMREVGGLTRDEIATACELTVDAVRSRIHRTRLDLRARLEAPLQTARREHVQPKPSARGTT